MRGVPLTATSDFGLQANKDDNPHNDLEKTFSDEDLILFVEGKIDLEFEDLKSHSQDCER